MSTKLFSGQAIVAALFCAVALAPAAFAADPVGEPKGKAGKPNPLNNVYFGEQHLHTNASVDAYIQGNHKNDIDMAFRYNKGEVVELFVISPVDPISHAAVDNRSSAPCKIAAPPRKAIR